MAYFTDNNGVVDAFLSLKSANAGRLRTDGQSLFSYDTRIAEHVPQKDGTAITVVYDYTRGGNAYKSQTTSSHVGLIKRRVPKRNIILVETAVHAGLIKA